LRPALAIMTANQHVASGTMTHEETTRVCWARRDRDAVRVVDLVLPSLWQQASVTLSTATA
jgi:hypothetical protein